MKSALFVFGVVLLTAIAIDHTDAGTVRVRQARDTPSEFHNVDVDQYLKNERAMKFQLKCVVYDGPCDRIGKYLKKTIPEFLGNQCANCDETQKKHAGKIFAHVQENYPKEWADAVKKFNGDVVTAEDAEKLEKVIGVKLAPTE